MRAKISLAALAHAEFDVALLDESLNHVDVEFRDMYLGLTRKWISAGRSVVITSHDDGLLHRFSNRLLRAGNKTLTEAAGPG
jgi:ABC-type polysaccharide/polyol phosphate transport system ATPase subunit